MLVSQLLQRITRNLTVRDITQMSAGEQTRVLDALNDAVREWFTDAPPTYRTNDASVLIHAPLQLSCNVTEESADFAVTSPTFPAGGYASDADLVGKTIVFGGDCCLNRVQSPGKLLKPYLGSTGSDVASVYCDTVPFGSADWQLIGNPVWRGQGMIHGLPVLPWQGAWNQGMFPFEGEWRVPTYLGNPVWWWTGSHTPGSNAASPYWYLYLWPLPSMRGTLTYKSEFIPPAYTTADLASHRDVPVPDAFVPLLCYLAMERLLGSVHWNPAIKEDAERENIARARVDLKRLSMQGRDTTARGCGTPFGF